MKIPQKINLLSKLRGCRIGDIEQEIAYDCNLSIATVLSVKHNAYKEESPLSPSNTAKINEWLIKKIDFFTRK